MSRTARQRRALAELAALASRCDFMPFPDMLPAMLPGEAQTLRREVRDNFRRWWSTWIVPQLQELGRLTDRGYLVGVTDATRRTAGVDGELWRLTLRGRPTGVRGVDSAAPVYVTSYRDLHLIGEAWLLDCPLAALDLEGQIFTSEDRTEALSPVALDNRVRAQLA